MRTTVLLAPGILTLSLAAPAFADDTPVTKVAATECAALGALRLPDVAIASAEAKAPAAADKGRVKVPHCKVTGVIGTEIRFEVLLPDTWNRRFAMGGGGGFVGSVENQVVDVVNRGYATAGTDTGHQADGLQAGWALDNPERQVNYGYLGVHRTSEVAKAIVRAYYGSDSAYSYFLGCSNGGRQGLMEAQRFPADFDGIVSGAPAYDFTRIAASFVTHAKATFPDPAQPHDVDRLADRPGAGGRCGAGQLRRRRRREGHGDRSAVVVPILAGPREGLSERRRGGRLSHHDEPCGAGPHLRADRRAVQGRSTQANRWAAKRTAAAGRCGSRAWSRECWRAAAARCRACAMRSARSSSSISCSATLPGTTRGLTSRPGRPIPGVAAKVLNADSVDLAAFKQRKGKLLLWHGWADPALNAQSTINYYERLKTADPQAPDYARLFMMPGVLHCAGGSGPDSVEWIDAIAAWTEKGAAPGPDHRQQARRRRRGDADAAALPAPPAGGLQRHRKHR